jgi:hypothetical protein
MDIIKELKLLNKNTNINKLVDDAMEQRKIWDQKAHILKVINLVREIEKLVAGKIFEQDEIFMINMASYGSGSSNHIGIILLSSQFDMLKNPKKKEYHNFFSSLSKLADFDIKNTPGAFDAYIKLDKSIDEQIYKILLSKELRSILDYSQEQLSINDNEQENQHKRPKL